MKKIAIILFVFLYLLPAIGFSIDVHFCGNKIQTVNVETINRNLCSCGSKMPKGCCRDIHTVIKLTDNQNPSSSTDVIFNNFAKQLANSAFLHLGVISDGFSIFIFPNYHAPPEINKPPVYLANCTFRI
jgi:hypothetical protein